eukprot:31600-Eustigmatos_ZCMA.PRE.1
MLLRVLYDISYLLGEHSEAHGYAEQGMELTAARQSITDGLVPAVAISFDFMLKAADASEGSSVRSA